MKKKDRSPTAIEICCGLGGTRKALTDAGFSIRQSIDFDAEVCRFHKRFWGDAINLNITDESFDDIESADVLSAGFPCQPFSTSGYRTGFNHDQGNVFDSLLRLIKQRKFKAVFLENVSGLISNDSGKTFKIILGSLSRIYETIEWQVINLIELGVPQNRPRLVIVGHNFSDSVLKDVRASFQADLFEKTDISNFKSDRTSMTKGQMDVFGRISENKLLNTVKMGKDQKPQFNLTSFILGEDFGNKAKVYSGRFWGRTGKTTFYISQNPYSHSVGTSMGAAPTFGLMEKEIEATLEARIKQISNWQSRHSGFYVFRLTPRETLKLFGPKAEIFGTSIETFDSSLATKYKLIGNMFAPDQAYPTLSALYNLFK